MKKNNFKWKFLWGGALLCTPLLFAPCLSNAQSFVYDSAVHNWGVPAGVIKLSITAAGGQGGGNGGGMGAVFTGVCRVVPGDTLSIVAAGMGGTSIVGDGHGGGGGTYVYDSNTLNLYVVAGGGGGNSYSDNNIGGNGGTDLAGNTCNPGSGPDGNALDGTGGNGSDTSTGWAPGGGGAGWISNGGNGGMVPNYICYGGVDKANGFWGGAYNSWGPDNDWGGYGGGGGGGWDAGGGGGGYNGGGGGNDACCGGDNGNSGDGGGSYLNGTLIGSANATNTGNGYVNISYIKLAIGTKKACFNSSNGVAMVSATGGTGAYTYSWAPGGQTKDTVSGLSAGTYTLMVTDSVGDYDSIPVIVSQESHLTAKVTAPAGVCTGNCTYLKINGSGGIPTYNYVWSTGSTVDSIFVCPLSNTTYSCVVTDSLGCTHDTAFLVKSYPLPTLNVKANKDTACNIMTLDSLIGTPSGGTFSGTGVTGRNFNPNAAGLGLHTVTYHYTDSLGCSNTDSIKVLVNSCAGIEEVSGLADNIHFYPNPFTTQVTVTVDTKETATLTMLNAIGQEVGTWNLKQGANIINTSGFAQGLYLMQVKTELGVLNRKVVKVN